MRVLIVSQYFAPELHAPSLRLEPIAAGLAAMGHEVEVLCGVPNHPDGMVQPGFERRWRVRREAGGYNVTHVWLRARPPASTSARLGAYASFVASASLQGAFASRPDIVFASSPPLPTGVVGALLASRFRVPLVLDVRDLWPEVAVALGELAPGRALRAAEGLERWLYRRADAITTPTEPFMRHISSIAPPGARVAVIANGTRQTWLDAGEMAPDRSALGIDPGPFVWTYAGNIGLSQDLDTAIEASRLLGAEYRLLILGGGSARARVEQQARMRAPETTVLRPAVPPEEAMRVMRASDALLVPLADREELGRSVPVKLYDSCAIGRPVIVAAPGEARRLAEQAEAAIVVPPGDPRALAEAVRRLHSEPELATAVTERGRAFAREHLREREVERLAELLRDLLNPRLTCQP